MKNILISIGLFFIAIIIFAIVLPFGLIYQLVDIFLVRDKRIYIADYFFKIAQCIDQLGNVVNRAIFNDVLLKRNSKNAFGDNQETISSVIGKNLEDNTLSKAGLLLNKILNKIENNHSIISIEDKIEYPTDQIGL
jgi:hypothetical protein